MKLCVLYSGGKDSNLALLKAVKEHEVICLLSLKPESEESEIFHYPNVDLTELQARVLNLPLIRIRCPDGEKGSLETLKKGLKRAKKMGVEGVVTGAIRSTYQATRFQRVCDELDLWCFNPLWLRDEISILREVVELGFQTVFVRVAGLSECFLGRMIDGEVIKELERLKNYVNPAGEGGEYETLVLYMPLFKGKIEILESKVLKKSEEEATLVVRKVRLCF